jgi:hypothetical protein
VGGPANRFQIGKTEEEMLQVKDALPALPEALRQESILNPR